MKRYFVFIILLSTIGLFAACKSSNSSISAGSTTAKAESNKAPNGFEPVNKNAVRGYDTVAYFQEGKPVKGSDQFAYEWMGAKWYFSRP